MTTISTFGLSLLLIEPPTTVPSTTFASATIVIEDSVAADLDKRTRNVLLAQVEAASNDNAETPARLVS